jgi:hypothetical protein
MDRWAEPPITEGRRVSERSSPGLSFPARAASTPPSLLAAFLLPQAAFAAGLGADVAAALITRAMASAANLAADKALFCTVEVSRRDGKFLPRSFCFSEIGSGADPPPPGNRGAGYPRSRFRLFDFILIFLQMGTRNPKLGPAGRTCSS